MCIIDCVHYYSDREFPDKSNNVCCQTVRAIYMRDLLLSESGIHIDTNAVRFSVTQQGNG